MVSLINVIQSWITFVPDMILSQESGPRSPVWPMRHRLIHSIATLTLNVTVTASINVMYLLPTTPQAFISRRRRMGSDNDVYLVIMFIFRH